MCSSKRRRVSWECRWRGQARLPCCPPLRWWCALRAVPESWCRRLPSRPIPFRSEAAACIVGVPLAGTGSASVLPSASLVVRSPRGSGKLVSTAAFSADSILAGIKWNGSALAPVLELTNVTLQGTTYPQIDLTNTGSVASALAQQVEAQIQAAIGNNPAAQHLLALVGLEPPAGDPSWPPINLPQLVANPSQAIADRK